MKREELKLEVSRFTTISALVREVYALLEHTDYKLEIVISANYPQVMEYLRNELESCRTLGRVKVSQA